MENQITIITPFYNPGSFLEICINSIMSQKYENFKVIFIDDASTDGSWEKLPHGNSKVVCIRNEVNLTALENIHNAIMNYCDKNSIVALLDGDDWFSSKNVLEYINSFYNENDCWIMYGSSQWTDGRSCFSSPYLEHEFSNIRKSPFRVSHLRSFRAGLYQKIQEQDQDFSCMKDKDGKFFKCTYDVAVMFPILEMAGFEKVKHNKKVLYIYNRDNPISDDKVRQQMQWDIHREISDKPSFKKVEKYV